MGLAIRTANLLYYYLRTLIRNLFDNLPRHYARRSQIGNDDWHKQALCLTLIIYSLQIYELQLSRNQKLIWPIIPGTCIKAQLLICLAKQILNHSQKGMNMEYPQHDKKVDNFLQNVPHFNQDKYIYSYGLIQCAINVILFLQISFNIRLSNIYLLFYIGRKYQQRHAYLQQMSKNRSQIELSQQLLFCYNYMNKRNISEIKIRKKTNFRPIMLTSKSIKPIQRSNNQKGRQQQKIETPDRNILKRRQSHNCAVYTSSITRNEMIKKLTQQYRQQLIKNLTQDKGKAKHSIKVKPVTPSIIQVEFDNEQSNKQCRYDNFINSINPKESNSETLNKYFYCTNSKNYDSFLNFNKHKLNNSVRFCNLTRSHSSKPADDWNKFLDKYYLNVKKIQPKNEAIQSKISEQKLSQISMKVEQYQNSLMRKMQERFKMNSSCQPITYEVRQMSPDQKNLNINLNLNMNPRKSSNSLQKIEQQMTQKRQATKKQHFVFGLGETTRITVQQVNKQKFEIYKDFLWKINFTNGLFVRIRDEVESPYKLFVGPGNNGMLIKGIMRRRFWWQIVDKFGEDVNLVWTQIKINDYFKYQVSNNKKNFFHSNRQNILLRARKVHSALQYTNSSHAEVASHNQANRQQNKQQQPNSMLSSLIDPNLRIFKGRDLQIWQTHLRVNKKYEDKQEIPYNKRIKTMVRRKKLVFIEQSKKLKIQNHFEANFFLGNKKALFYSLRKYYRLLGKDPFQFIPLTFHISKGLEDPQYNRFLQKYDIFQQKKKNKQSQNIWIVKPGEMTNRGRGITVCSTLDQIKLRLKSKQKAKNGQLHTYIIQKYIQKPLLYHKRKFDIRHYMMMTCVNGRFKGYWFEQGYLRTTSFEYNIKNCKDLYTHLTNDAIQKYSADYGKFQKGNKVSYTDFQKYLNTTYRNKNSKTESQVDKYDFFSYALPKMRQLAGDAMRATFMQLSPNRYEHNFELFGLDFMLDQEMNVYLIQVNTNPCLQTSCPLLSRLISSVIQNVFKICVDPLFPPPFEWPPQRKLLTENALEQNRFSIIFDESEEQLELNKLYENAQNLQQNNQDIGLIDEEDEFYEDEGKEWVEDEK